MSRREAQSWLCSKMGIYLPYYSMGRVDSYDLFGPNELVLFAFYEKNVSRYRKVADIGANIGLHSLLMLRLGWDVVAYEPDPVLYKELERNLHYSVQSGDRITMQNAAVAEKEGYMQFVRVLNNLTGSCLTGASKEPYGPMEKVTVETVDCRQIFDWADLAKIDVEGYESQILLTLTEEQLKRLDLICELRGELEAMKVLKHIKSIGGEVYTQKNDWKPAKNILDMPTKHQEGSIFISATAGPWE